MVSRYQGKVGEYLWEKEKQRLETTQEHPWEHQSKGNIGRELLILALVCAIVMGGIVSLFLLF